MQVAGVEFLKMPVNERVCSKLARDLGANLLAALKDCATVELMVNPDGRVWIERLGESMQCIGSLGVAQTEAIIKTVAGFHSKEITRSNPIIEGEFPLDQSRFAGQIPPVVSSPCFAIRKKAIQVYTLDDYVRSGALTQKHSDAIHSAIFNHRNILVIGGTGSGKTTLINAIIHQMVGGFPDERVVILEDTAEIQCTAQNFVQYHTTLDVSMTQLLKTTLRMRPDRILVGEVRGAEALDLLDCWNTGHEGGAATLHANNALMGLTRLESLISRNPAAPKDIKRLISEAVHLIIHISRTAQGRIVKEIIGIQSFSDNRYEFQHYR
jgi:type IV secretion system protein VirB11